MNVHSPLPAATSPGRGDTPQAPGMVGQSPFGEEDSIVVDKWIMDVCGEEDIQFPSHRKSQFPAYILRLRAVEDHKKFNANTFDYPSRSGTREVLVLQRMLESLGSMEQSYTRQFKETTAQLARVMALLEEKTLGMSALSVSTPTASATATMAATQLSPAAALPSSSLPPTSPERKTADTHCRSIERTPSTAEGHRTAVADEDEDDIIDADKLVAPTTAAAAAAAKRGYTLLVDTPITTSSLATLPVTPTSKPTSASSASVINTRSAEYTQRLHIAQRYIAEQQRLTAEAGNQGALLSQKHDDLLELKVQLDKEYSALQQTEKIVVERHGEVVAECTKEEEAYAAELARWEALLAETEATAATEETTGAMKMAEAEDSCSSLHASSELAVLRAALTEAAEAAHAARTALQREDLSHSSQSRQARQRLRDWQEVATKVRYTRQQLQGQTHVIAATVAETARRLAEDSGAGSGYMDQFWKLNSLLLERSSEFVAGYTRSADMAVGAAGSGGVGAGGATLSGAGSPAGGGAVGADEVFYTVSHIPIPRAPPPLILSPSASSPEASSSSRALPPRPMSSASTRHQRQDSNSSSSAAQSLYASSTTTTPTAGGGGASHSHRIPTGGSGTGTPRRRLSLSRGVATPVTASRASSVVGSASRDDPHNGGGSPSQQQGATHSKKKRSRYELVSHLQRWAAVLIKERLSLLQAAGLVPSERGMRENVPLEIRSEAELRAKYKQLQQALLS